MSPLHVGACSHGKDNWGGDSWWPTLCTEGGGDLLRAAHPGDVSTLVFYWEPGSLVTTGTLQYFAEMPTHCV